MKVYKKPGCATVSIEGEAKEVEARLIKEGYALAPEKKKEEAPAKEEKKPAPAKSKSEARRRAAQK